MNNFLVTQKFYENNRKKQSRCIICILKFNQIRVLIIFLLGFSASLLYELSLYRWGISTKSLSITSHVICYHINSMQKVSEYGNCRLSSKYLNLLKHIDTCIYSIDISRKRLEINEKEQGQ